MEQYDDNKIVKKEDHKNKITETHGDKVENIIKTDTRKTLPGPENL